MAVHTVVNDAGSAGKTTTSVTLAALLAERGKRTLLWDNDPQGNATLFAGAEAVEGKTGGEVLTGQARLDEVIVPSAVDKLWVVPATRALHGAAVELTRNFGGEQQIKLALATMPGEWDAVIIDCPGSMTVLMVAALVATDTVIATAQPTLKELEGLPALEETIAQIATLYNPGLALSAVVPCIVPPASSGALYTEGLERMRELYGELVTSPIRRSVRVPEAYSQRVPLTIHAPLEQVTSDYQQVLDELIGRKVMP